MATDPFPVEKYYKLGVSRGGKCLEPGENTKDPGALWQCSQGHEWRAQYKNIGQGKWCPTCAANDRFVPAEKYYKLGVSRGGKCLEPVRGANNPDAIWQCADGHEWKAAYGSVYQGRWCPVCAGTSPISASGYSELALSRGGQCVEPGINTQDSNSLWRCAKGHEWRATYGNINQGRWCPACSAGNHASKGELEVFEYVKSLCPDALSGDRTALKPLELDIYVPSRKFGIEYNGLIWHSSWVDPYDRMRHAKKASSCRDAKIQLLAFYEDEWISKQELIKAMIRWRLGAFSGTKLNARDLTVQKLNKNVQFSDFFVRNHIDGHANASWAVGLFDGDKLIMCASVRKNFAGEIELARLATDYDFSVRGGAAKLIAAIKRESDNAPLVSYSNNRLSYGNVYEKMGFKKVSDQNPSYWYTDGVSVRIWRFKCKRINDPEILAQYPTEKAQALGGVFSRKYLGNDKPLYQIHDYGHIKWIL